MNEILSAALGGALLTFATLTVRCTVDHVRRHRRGANKRFIAAYKAGFHAADLSRTARDAKPARIPACAPPSVINRRALPERHTS